MTPFCVTELRLAASALCLHAVQYFRNDGVIFRINNTEWLNAKYPLICENYKLATLLVPRLLGRYSMVDRISQRGSSDRNELSAYELLENYSVIQA